MICRPDNHQRAQQRANEDIPALHGRGSLGRRINVNNFQSKSIANQGRVRRIRRTGSAAWCLPDRDRRPRLTKIVVRRARLRVREHPDAGSPGGCPGPASAAQRPAEGSPKKIKKLLAPLRCQSGHSVTGTCLRGCREPGESHCGATAGCGGTARGKHRSGDQHGPREQAETASMPDRASGNSLPGRRRGGQPLTTNSCSGLADRQGQISPFGRQVTKL
jgi:hypothetical protein